MDVLQTAGGPVDHVFALTVSENAAGDLHIVVLHRKHAAVVVNCEGYFTDTKWLLGIRAVEYYIVEAGRTEHSCLLLAKDPPDGIDNVCLAAAIGTDHRRYPLAKSEPFLIGKGFKAVKRQFGNIHDYGRLPC